MNLFLAGYPLRLEGRNMGNREWKNKVVPSCHWSVKNLTGLNVRRQHAHEEFENETHVDEVCHPHTFAGEVTDREILEPAPKQSAH